MWMEGDVADGGENILNATPSSFSYPACLVWTNPRVAATCHCDRFAKFLHQENHLTPLCVMFLITYFDIKLQLCYILPPSRPLFNNLFLNRDSAAFTVGVVESTKWSSTGVSPEGVLPPREIYLTTVSATTSTLIGYPASLRIACVSLWRLLQRHSPGLQFPGIYHEHSLLLGHN